MMISDTCNHIAPYTNRRWIWTTRWSGADSGKDPFHANFFITSNAGRTITSTHYFPVPNGGKKETS
jgi:hypothetical protein